MAKHFRDSNNFDVNNCSFIHIIYVQQVHRVSESTSDITCMKSPAYKTGSHNPPPIYDYVLVNDSEPRAPSEGSIRMELGPYPLDAPAVLPELGENVLHSDVKDTVSYA